MFKTPTNKRIAYISGEYEPEWVWRGMMLMPYGGKLVSIFLIFWLGILFPFPFFFIFMEYPTIKMAGLFMVYIAYSTYFILNIIFVPLDKRFLKDTGEEQ